jgi:hypothetical protein
MGSPPESYYRFSLLFVELDSEESLIFIAIKVISSAGSALP